MSDFLQALLISIAASWTPVPQEAELVFAGDAMQHAAQIDAARTPQGTYDYSECFATITPYVETADYAVVNLETPLGGAPFTGYPCFSAPDSYAECLKNVGFDLFLTANNHTLDRRNKGLKRTVSVLDSLEVDHIGTYTCDSVRERVIPFIKDINGFKIGFLNYTYGTNGFTPGENVIVDYIDTTLISRDIIATRNAGAELITVAIHWGDEYILTPNKTQKRLADFLTGNGVDMVIGSHPHVIQPIELRYSTNDSTQHPQLVAYSLGNFISNMRTRDTRGGIMLKVKLKRDNDGLPFISEAKYKPVFTVPPLQGHNYRLVDATEQVPDPTWDYHRKQFLQSAKAIFDKYNIGVEMDSASLNSIDPNLPPPLPQGALH